MFPAPAWVSPPASPPASEWSVRSSPRLAVQAAAASAVPSASLTEGSKKKKEKKGGDEKKEKKGGDESGKKRKLKQAAAPDDDAAKKAPAALDDDAVKKAKKKAKKEAKKAAKQEVDTGGASSSDNAAVASGSAAEDLTFDGVAFDAKTLAKLKSSYPAPTGIQARAWPVVLSGQDLIAVAKTGSGKTLAFLLPIFSRVSTGACGAAPAGSVRALILAPTRELASQIGAECIAWAPLCGLGACIVYGGTPVGPQIAELKKTKPALLVATPGRLVDLLGQKGVALGSSCSTVVLDEADRMLDMGFEPQLKQVRLPPTSFDLLTVESTYQSSPFASLFNY